MAAKAKYIPPCSVTSKLRTEHPGNGATEYIVKFNKLTEGEMLALIHAMMLARTTSVVASDLSAYLGNALLNAKKTVTKAQAFLDELNGRLDVQVVRSEDISPGWTKYIPHP
jgi:hypothetical protein